MKKTIEYSFDVPRDYPEDYKCKDDSPIFALTAYEDQENNKDLVRTIDFYANICVKCGRVAGLSSMSITDEQVSKLDDGWYQYSVKIKPG